MAFITAAGDKSPFAQIVLERAHDIFKLPEEIGDNK